MIAIPPSVLTLLAAPTDGAPGQPLPGAPEPTLRPGLDQAQVTPGVVGFLFTALMVVMAIVVIRLMVRSIRRVQYRSDQAEDMLVDRYQSYLPEDVRHPEDEFDVERRGGSDLEVQRARLQRKYPGYLDAPPPQPKAPDSGRD